MQIDNGTTELNVTEMREIDGGILQIVVLVIAALIAVARPLS